VEDSLGTRTWGAAPLLASIILRRHLSSQMEICTTREDETEGRRTMKVLELGAGTGLVGLAMAEFIKNAGGSKAEVHLTDYHPDVLKNLQGNVEENRWTLMGSEALVSVHVSALDWSHPGSSNGDLDGKIDILIAAGKCRIQSAI
jgi:methylase of polypeptide subunit release factors